MSVKNLLKKAAAKNQKAKPTKNALPEVIDSTLIKSLTLLREGKQQEKEGKSKVELAQSQLLPRAHEEHNKICQENGSYYSSIKLGANDDLKFTVTFPNKYSKITSDHEESLKEIYGEHYDQYFKTKTEVAFSDKALKDENFIQTISNLIGEEKFLEYFKVTETIEINDRYHEDRLLNSQLAEKHIKAENSGVVKCNSPSFRE